MGLHIHKISVVTSTPATADPVDISIQDEAMDAAQGPTNIQTCTRNRGGSKESNDGPHAHVYPSMDG